MVTEPRTLQTFNTLPATLPQQVEPPITGAIGYFQLTDWWLATFSPAERERIEFLYRPAHSANPRPLTQGEDVPPATTSGDLLASLATWLYRPQDRPLARRVLAKAGERAVVGGRILELHYTYQVMIQIYYRDRHDPAAHKVAIEACGKMITLAPQAVQAFRKEYPGQPLPRHYGYHLLTLIRERQQHYMEAIRLAQMAFDQGWEGDWEKRINTYKVKLRLAAHGSG